MSDTNQSIKDEILILVLDDVPFDGWTWGGVQAAAQKAGHETHMAKAVFPSEMQDVLLHFSDWADRQMLDKLKDLDPESMRVRDRVRLAVQTRLSVLKDHKEAVKSSLKFWLHPFRKMEAARMVWRTADRIWDWAGDTAEDYNRYTKRGLLSGVLTSTTLFWINNNAEDMDSTHRFLDKRIENVMQLGKVIGQVKTRFNPKRTSNA